MADQRLPIVNADDGVWGDIIREYLLKEHYNGDANVTPGTSTNGGHQFVTIRPGTTSAAPLTLSSGPLRTTAAIGAVEFNSGKLYFTSTGPVRMEIVTDTATQTLTNKTLTSPTISAPTFSGSYSFGGTPTWPTFNQNTTGSAATLTTSRNIQTNLASTAAASFNGSANVTPGVTGTLPVANGGTGRATSTTAYGIIAAGNPATSAQQTIAPGTAGQFLKSAGASALASFASITQSDVANLTTDLAAKANTSDVNTALDGKLDAHNVPNGVYINDASGVPISATYSTGATPLTMAARGADGTLIAATPTASAHLATKGYVDSGTSTLTSKTISGEDNVLTNIPQSAISGLSTQIMPVYSSRSNLIIEGNFENDASWANAWGAPTTDQKYSGTKSRQLTTTGAGTTADRITLTHDGTGNPAQMDVGAWQMFMISVRVRRHTSNTAGGTVYLRARYNDGTEKLLAGKSISADSISSTGWTALRLLMDTNGEWPSYYLTLEFDSTIPSGNIFYVDAATMVDATAISAVQYDGSDYDMDMQRKFINNTNSIEVYDNSFTIQSGDDVTKQVEFLLSSITTGTTRTLTVPNTSGTIAVLGQIPWAPEMVLNSGALVDGYNDMAGGISVEPGPNANGITLESVWVRLGGTPGSVVTGGSCQFALYAGTATTQGSLVTTVTLANGDNNQIGVLGSAYDHPANRVFRVYVTMGASGVTVPVHVQLRGRYKG